MLVAEATIKTGAVIRGIFYADLVSLIPDRKLASIALLSRKLPKVLLAVGFILKVKVFAVLKGLLAGHANKVFWVIMMVKRLHYVSIEYFLATEATSVAEDVDVVIHTVELVLLVVELLSVQRLAALATSEVVDMEFEVSNANELLVFYPTFARIADMSRIGFSRC